MTAMQPTENNKKQPWHPGGCPCPGLSWYLCTFASMFWIASVIVYNDWTPDMILSMLAACSWLISGVVQAFIEVPRDLRAKAEAAARGEKTAVYGCPCISVSWLFQCFAAGFWIVSVIVCKCWDAENGNVILSFLAAVSWMTSNFLYQFVELPRDLAAQRKAEDNNEPVAAPADVPSCFCPTPSWIAQVFAAAFWMAHVIACNCWNADMALSFCAAICWELSNLIWQFIELPAEKKAEAEEAAAVAAAEKEMTPA